MEKTELTKKSVTKNHRYQAMIFGAALLIILAIVAYAAEGKWWSNISQQYSKQGPAIAEDQKTAAQQLALDHSEPVRIKIAKIGVDAPAINIGLNANKTIETPSSGADVGWYKYSPTPGEIGPSVMVGHLDTVNGAAVFYRLHELVAGDTIEITRQDGKVAVFKVIATEKYPQDDFATDKVYGKIDYAGLRLITCQGTYLRAKGHYSDNLVVYASLAEVK